jgi:hypothetical protein
LSGTAVVPMRLRAFCAAPSGTEGTRPSARRGGRPLRATISPKLHRARGESGCGSGLGQARLGRAMWRQPSDGTTNMHMHVCMHMSHYLSCCMCMCMCMRMCGTTRVVGVHTAGGAVAHQQIMSSTTPESRVEIWPALPG